MRAINSPMGIIENCSEIVDGFEESAFNLYILHTFNTYV